MHKLDHALAQIGGPEPWSIRRPQAGTRKACYLARSATREVFVAFGVAVAPLLRLAEIGVAPPVLAHGTCLDETWVVQEAIGGPPPDRPWLRTHNAALGRLIHTYHTDGALAALLDQRSSRDSAHLPFVLAGQLRQRLERLARSTSLPASIAPALDRFERLGEALVPQPPVPVHAEPNTGNMLVDGDRLYLIDWDEIHLADPLADIGPLLWWYLPEDQWASFLATQGMSFTAAARTGIFWHAARASLEVLLWRVEHGRDDGGFGTDFLAASHVAPNPRT